MRTIPTFPLDDKYRIVEAWLSRLEQSYSGDIALVVAYGSYVRGTSHARSDIDLYFVPTTERGYEMCRDVIIEGIGYDFWPLSFADMERMLAENSPRATLIGEGEIIYYRDADVLARYRELAARALSGRRAPRQIPEGFFEEMKSVYNKMIHACDTHDAPLAQQASDILRSEMHELLPDETFPHFIGNFDALRAACRAHEAHLRALVEAQGTPIREFDSIEAYVRSERNC